jgi:isopentenyl diphosphate isomerase/L-lactate dehydrogenase-like FMN-dependent dehydrogenase
MASSEPFRTLAQAEAMARRRLPPALFDRISEPMGGSRRTCVENTRIFDDVLFRPKAATYVAARDLTTTVLGGEISLPVLLACPGSNRLLHPDGEPGAAAAATAAGTIDIAAMGTGHPIEEVCAAARGRVWQQVYLSRGRDGVEELVTRSRAAGVEAIVVTVDVNITPTPVTPGADVPPLGVNWPSARRHGLDALRRPRWLRDFVVDQLPERRRSPMEQRGVMPGGAPAHLRTGEFSDQLAATWDDIAWIRTIWGGPLVVKGVLTADDARRAVDAGAAAVVVSNHGGLGLDVLGLDPVTPSLRALPEVVRACGDDVEVLFDSGVRSGTHAVAAIALGARAVLIGRPYLFGLAAAGRPGVARVLEIFRAQIDRVLGGLGCPSVRALDATYVEVPPSWPHGREAHD